MRREISGIFLFFLVIFILISLLSYSPHDPSIHNAGPTGQIHNLFGVFGAHLAGLLVGLWGIGVFWLPIVFLISSIQFFSNQPRHRILITLSGGLILVITSGSLLAITQNQYILFGQSFSSGGMLGIPLKSFFSRYAGPTGGTIILLVFWLIGFVMTTGFSIVRFGAGSIVFSRYAAARLKKRYEGFQKNRARAAKLKTVNGRGTKTKTPSKTKLKIRNVPPKAPKAPPLKQEVFDFVRAEQGFQLPPVSFLDDADERIAYADNENLQMKSKLLEKKLEDFGVNGQVVAITPGPVITTFEYAPAPGVKINKVASLSDDLALALRAASIRIVAPIPGKAVIGIEVPNAERETVRFKELVVDETFTKSKSKLTLCLGKSIEGNPVTAALEKMPHLLIAGATGSGKSVALNTMIGSFLYKAGPEDVKLIMIDPKRIELSIYDGIPHLITPVVTDIKKATNALHWAVKEMERRYKLLSDKQARNVQQYNNKIDKLKKTAEGESETKLPYIVIIIDELADLMIVASRDVEVALTRLAQMARAAGIHLILATQRPSVDVLTGIIKANFPTRLSFQVSSKTDSRTIIDTNGAENLLGNGDMLFLPPGTAKLQRIHGAFISETEIRRVIDFIKAQKSPEYDEAVITTSAGDKNDGGPPEFDQKYDEALALVTKSGQASISMIQRHLRIGYNRAARIIETMETERVVGPSDGVKPREVLVRGYDDMP